MKRRRVLQAGAAVTAGGIVIGIDEGYRTLGRETTGQEPESLMAIGRGAAVPEGATAGQTYGGIWNQNSYPSTQTFTGIKNSTVVGEDTIKANNPIVVSEDGLALISHNEGNNANAPTTLLDIEDAEILASWKTIVRTSPGLFTEDGKIIQGDSRKRALRNQNGDILQKVEEGDRGGIKRTGNQVFSNAGYGIPQFPVDNLQNITKHEYGGNPPIGGLLLYPEDNSFVTVSDGELVSINYEEERIKDRFDPGRLLNAEISTDGKHIFNPSSDYLEVIERPEESKGYFTKVTEEPFNGFSGTPPVVVEEDEETQIISGNNSPREGTIQAYRFDEEDGELNLDWEIEVPAGSFSIQRSGDGIYAGGLGHLTGINRHTGEKLFQKDKTGYLSQPYGNKMVLGKPDGGAEILEMETENIAENPDPELTKSLTSVPDSGVAIGETARMSLEVENTGGAFDGSLIFTYNSTPDTYTDTIGVTIPATTTVELDFQLTPLSYRENAFQSQYNPETRTYEVELPYQR